MQCFNLPWRFALTRTRSVSAPADQAAVSISLGDSPSLEHLQFLFLTIGIRLFQSPLEIRPHSNSPRPSIPCPIRHVSISLGDSPSLEQQAQAAPLSRRLRFNLPWRFALTRTNTIPSSMPIPSQGLNLPWRFALTRTAL